MKAINLSANRLFRYENKLLILLSFIFAFVIFDRAALPFLVPFFDKELSLNNTQIGLLTSLLALAWAVSGYLMGTLSDRFGRKPVVIIFFLLSMLMPLSVIYSANSFASLSLLVLFGASITGCFPIVLATIPSETIPHQYIAQTLGLVMGIGELAGGFAAPAIAGWSADQFGLHTAFFIAAGAALSAGLIAFLLYETAPALLNKKNNDANPAMLAAI